MNYQPHDFQTAKHNIIEYLYGDITPVPHPKAHLVCAQPGAGKTGLISQFAGNAAFINGDEYRRYYPGYRKRYEEIGNLIIDETKGFGKMVIIFPKPFVYDFFDGKIPALCHLERGYLPVWGKDFGL